MKANTLPFIRFIQVPPGREQEALLGFSLPFLPDMLTSPWLTGSNVQERLCEALLLQTRLIQSLWSSGATSLDLRFVGSDDLPGVAICLLCRLRRPPQMQGSRFEEYCIVCARRVQQLFADFGYELQSLGDESSLLRYLQPFQIQSISEIRKHEELFVVEDAYTEYEFYVSYPWQWTISNRLRLFQAMLQRQSNCLVSIYLEPTQLTPQEQRHLNHAASIQVRNLLFESGPNGQSIYNIYKDYEQSLRQPYLLRISVAASSPQTLERVGRIFIDELHTSQIPGTGPILQFPQSSSEWQWACHNLLSLAAVPWGYSHGMDMPATARLRYLMDDKAAGMAFRLPVAHFEDISGVPVRSLFPTSGVPPASGTRYSPFDKTTHISPMPSTSNIPGSMTPQTSLPDTVLPAAALTIHKPQDLIGNTLGNCQIESLLGQGGFGAVYRAKQSHLQRVVAVKVVLAAIAKEDAHTVRKMLLRFDREAQAIARMDHPHILTLYEYQSEPFPYLVMPYMAGGSLGDEMRSSGHRPLSVHGMLTILNQVASALDHAHQQHLIHRDIKPDNLLRHHDGRIMLSDFGIVQLEDDEITALTTNKQHSPYTPAYASPEQQQHLDIDYRSDIYSLGIIVYELLCGHRPFKKPFEHVFSPPPAMHTFGIRVHPTIEAVIAKALAKQPELRYQTAGEMAAAFQEAFARN